MLFVEVNTRSFCHTFDMNTLLPSTQTNHLCITLSFKLFEGRLLLLMPCLLLVHTAPFLLFPQLSIFLSLHSRYLLCHYGITLSFLSESVSELRTYSADVEQWCSNIYQLSTTENDSRFVNWWNDYYSSLHIVANKFTISPIKRRTLSFLHCINYIFSSQFKYQECPLFLLCSCHFTPPTDHTYFSHYTDELSNLFSCICSLRPFPIWLSRCGQMSPGPFFPHSIHNDTWIHYQRFIHMILFKWFYLLTICYSLSLYIYCYSYSLSH